MSYNISLNFFPLLKQDFNIILYRKKYKGELKGELEKTFGEKPYKVKLPDFPNGIYNSYWVYFCKKDGFEKTTISSRDNYLITIRYLLFLLSKKCENVLNKNEFRLQKKYSENVGLIIGKHAEGSDIIFIEPYFFHQKKKIGYIIHNKFILNKDINFNKKIQILSGSLDRNGKSNSAYYSFKYDKIKKFHSIFYDKIFNKEEILDFKLKLEQVEGRKLAIKEYQFRNGKASSQYRGIQKLKPFSNSNTDDKATLYFIYKKGSKDFAIKVINSLRGKLFPNNFKGLEDIYDLKNVVKGDSIESFDINVIKNTIEKIKSINGKVIPIILTSSRDTEIDDIVYHRLKWIFTKNGIPVQIITKSLLKKDFMLKYSVANIALQIFAKLGGIPWKVVPRNKKCLIVGIGQAHQIKTISKKTVIEKYFAYSVLLDSSGQYRSINVISESETDQKDYLNELKINLKKVIEKYRGEYKKIVLHTPFKIRISELLIIQDVLKQASKELNIEFVVLRINTTNKYFGYNKDVNSLVPFESTYFPLSQKQYLVWFEGLQYHNRKINKRIGGPTLIEFYWSSSDLTEENKRDYLQDALNLSGANWRGFNSKSLPVSIFYCQIISKLIKRFHELNLEEISISNLKPWFL